jgi:hypothetical protein
MVQKNKGNMDNVDKDDKAPEILEINEKLKDIE